MFRQLLPDRCRRVALAARNCVMQSMSELRAWVEISVDRLRRNFALINADKPAGLQIASVLKDDAYGHGAVRAAQVAIEAGATFMAVGALDGGRDLGKGRVASRRT